MAASLADATGGEAGATLRETAGLAIDKWYPCACAICGDPVRPWQIFNWDHIVPMSRGGPRGRINKALAHQLCNAVKGNRHPFSLRTAAEREAVADLVSPRTYRKLQRLWAEAEETT